ncbi:conserved unknown protein [Ectocarpus siliculosus]|uniref:Uncharacterized protein n=1 Tax=Ectocarpus siliculosus TaxID=2880 RepID=D8LTW7_ECTSI|nr:conserved unknown protein [Ectocarpus siliculosus]|eukprot:CBN75357.1 conserved unknown protein [Ectocarpus siliculosus]
MPDTWSFLSWPRVTSGRTTGGVPTSQRVGKLFEVAAVAFLGLWACYFASFFLGVATMTVIGTSFLFYWLLAPNVTSFRRNRALKGSIAPFPGARGNSVAIFSARVASAVEEYHPVTGQPVFLRMVIEDEDGRALKFRTRTRAEYARVRPGMAAEAILVSPDERFEEILGVSDTFIPAANVWVGEYPYLDKVVMRRLLASRDLKRRRQQQQRRDADEDEELDPITYRDSWTQTRPLEDDPSRGGGGGGGETGFSAPPAHAGEGEAGLPNGGAGTVLPDFGAYFGESEDEEPYYEGVGSSGFSGAERRRAVAAGERSAAGRGRSDGQQQQQQQQQQWERVSGKPRPRRRPPAAATSPSRRFEGQGGGGGGYSESGGRRVRGGAKDAGRGGAEGGATTRYGETSDDSRMAAGRKEQR